MVWTAPRTWVDGEIPTASLFNLHIRDNENVLKTSIGNDGRFLGLSSATLADLSAANVTGLASPSTSNTYTAAVNSFNGGSTVRIVVPVGTDKFDGTAGNKTAGSIWVEGDYLHHIASNQNEWRYLGTFVSTPAGATLGSLWIESNELHYIDADGDERRIVPTETGFHTDTTARAGSLWVETYLHWIREAAQIEGQGHADAHADSAHTDSHGDTHDDVGHSDTHSDTHSDSGGHSDAHDDNHADSHNDSHLDFVDGGPHADSHGDSHTDIHTDTHDDADTHSDSHSDTHSDSHTDTHDDSHSDAGHGDSHGDAPESMGT
jgi:hypothetical protein